MEINFGFHIIKIRHNDGLICDVFSHIPSILRIIIFVIIIFHKPEWKLKYTALTNGLLQECD